MNPFQWRIHRARRRYDKAVEKCHGDGSTWGDMRRAVDAREALGDLEHEEAKRKRRAWAMRKPTDGEAFVICGVLFVLALVVALIVGDIARKHDKCWWHALTGQACIGGRQ